MHSSRTMSGLMGFGFETMSLGGPEYFPGVPGWVYATLFWVGLLLMVVPVVAYFLERFGWRWQLVIERPGKQASKEKVKLGQITDSDYDASISDVINFIVSGRWAEKEHTIQSDDEIEGHSANVLRAMAAIEQRALNGELVLFGKPSARRHGPFIRIQKEFWEDHGLNLLGYAGNSVIVGTERKVPGGHAAQKYHELAASKVEAEKIWGGHE